MYKLRTMHAERGKGWSPITGTKDERVFPFGALLRTLKIDELPQLVNVLKGEMSIVGPRPEDPEIVKKHYSERQRETLKVLPGLASPGSIYDYTHGRKVLDSEYPEKEYVRSFLPLKLALEYVYVQSVSFMYDLKIIFRTAWVIAAVAFGKRDFREPPEMKSPEFSALAGGQPEDSGERR